MAWIDRPVTFLRPSRFRGGLLPPETRSVSLSGPTPPRFRGSSLRSSAANRPISATASARAKGLHPRRAAGRHPEGQLLHGGLRASELVALRWDDIDFATGKLHSGKPLPVTGSEICDTSSNRDRIPKRPYGMWQRTYDRLVQRLVAIENSVGGLANMELRQSMVRRGWLLKKG